MLSLFQSGPAAQTAAQPMHKKRLRLRSVLLAALLLLLLGNLLLPHGYLPTGNPALDRFAALLLDKLAEQEGAYFNNQAARWLDERKLPYPQSWYEADAEFEFEEIKNWEALFADDPDYWELRFRCGRGTADGRCEKALELLGRGVYSEGMCWPLLPRAAYGAEDVTGYALVSALIQKDPDNGALYMIRSYINVQYGEPEASQEDLRKAAAAPQFRFGESGLQRYWQHPGVHALFPGNRAVYGYLMQETHGLPLWLKEQFKEYEVCVLIGYSPQILDDFTAACAKFAESRPPQYQELVAAEYNVRLALFSVVDKAYTLDPTQAKEHEELSELLDSRLLQAGRIIGWKDSEMIRQLSYEDGVRTLPPVATNIYGEDWQTEASLVSWSWHPSRGAFARRFADELRYRRACRPVIEALLAMDPPPFNAWAEGRSRFDESK